MSIVRIVKSENYSVISNGFINDESLSWKAKGLLVFLLSKPNDWQIYIEHLKNCSKDGKESTASGLKELIEAGYIIRRHIRNEKGQLTIYNYTVYEYKSNGNVEKINEKPESGKPESGKPESEKPESEKPALDNQSLLSTDSNQVLNKLNTDKKIFLDFIFLTEKEHESLIEDYGSIVIEKYISKLDAYLTNNEKKRRQYKDHNKVIRTWINDDPNIKKIQRTIYAPPKEKINHPSPGKMDELKARYMPELVRRENNELL